MLSTCGSGGPGLLPCFHLICWSEHHAVNRGWIAKVPVNSDMEKAWDESSAYCVLTKKKERKKTCTDMPIFFFFFFFTGTLYFCVHLFLENMWGVHPHTCVSFAFLCNGSVCSQSVVMFKWCGRCKRCDLGWQWLFLTASPVLWETAFPVHMRRLIKGIFLPVLCGVCSIPVKTLLAGFFFF